MYTPKEHEETFEIKPIGVRYICEHCNDGEMVVDINQSIIPNLTEFKSSLIKHKCQKCGGVLELPKSYPYIEWVKNE